MKKNVFNPKSYLFLLFSMAAFGGFKATAQKNDSKAKFYIVTSEDTLLAGNYFEMRIVLENLEGKFKPPVYDDFDVVGGPYQSSNYSMINGVTSQKATYTYLLKPKKTGKLTLRSAILDLGDSTLETDPKTIVVLDNPKGIVRKPKTINDNGFFQFIEPDVNTQPQEDNNTNIRKGKKIYKL